MKRATLLLAAVLAGGQALAQTEPAPRADALLIAIDGAIGPAVSDFVERGIERAASEGASAVVLRLDTPGGLDTSMRAIIKAILASPVPVMGYVGPSGARAASAGTYILYASHVAAMAPATNLGAATPVSIGPGKPPGGDGKAPGGKREEEADGEQPAPAQGGAMERKVVNDAAAYIRGLAKLRGRNAEWAEEAVRTGASLTAEDALEKGVIDLMAESVEDLVSKVDGRSVDVAGREITLDTQGWTVGVIEPDWRTRFLAVLTNPSVAYMLLLLGVYGLLFEVYVPGAVVPGVVGAISLLFALYAFHVLPVNYAGLALILVGVGLMAAEVFTPSFGALGIGGLCAFVVGSVILMDTDVEGYTISLPLIVTAALASAGLFAATVFLMLRLRARPVVTGLEEMVGAVAEALESFSGEGRVHAHGEVWSAHSGAPVTQGQKLRITRVDGLILEVEPLQEEK